MLSAVGHFCLQNIVKSWTTVAKSNRTAGFADIRHWIIRNTASRNVFCLLNLNSSVSSSILHFVCPIDLRVDSSYLHSVTCAGCQSVAKSCQIYFYTFRLPHVKLKVPRATQRPGTPTEWCRSIVAAAPRRKHPGIFRPYSAKPGHAKTSLVNYSLIMFSLLIYVYKL